MVLLEAMQFGLPIVTTTQGAIPEILRDGVTAYIIEPRDIISLKKKISMLINSEKLRNNMGKAARDEYLRHYSISIFEKNFLGFYNQFLFTD